MTIESDVLTADRVNSTFIDCLFKDGEDTSNYIAAEGITLTVGFHPDRLEKHRHEIHDMLSELPDEFKTSGGGGYTFLNACLDRHGNQWTGMHQTQEHLVQLGIAIGEVEYCLPREAWMALPGGMPYFMVKQ